MFVQYSTTNILYYWDPNGNTGSVNVQYDLDDNEPLNEFMDIITTERFLIYFSMNQKESNLKLKRFKA